MTSWKLQLTAEERERMERIRKARGMRSLAELVRVLLVEEAERRNVGTAEREQSA